MLDAVRKFGDGAEPPGLAAPRVPQAKLRSFEGIVPKGVDWRTLGASDEEMASLQQKDASAARPAAGQKAGATA